MHFIAATVQEEAGDDDAVCQITSECFQKSLQRHLPMYGFSAPPHVLSLPLSPSESNFLYVQSQHLCLSLSPSADDATRVILKSTDDYINANYINVSVSTTFFFLSFKMPAFNIDISVSDWELAGWCISLTSET